MLKSVNGIHIEGKKFDSSTDLPIFPKEKSRLAVIFGRNGEGKSTISDGLRALGPEYNRYKGEAAKIDFTMKDGCIEPVDTVIGNAVHVFSESFVEDKVRIKDSGLEAIIMLGDTCDIEKQIKTINDALTAESDAAEKLTAELSQYQDDTNSLSPGFHKHAVKSGLAAWALRQKDIKGLQQKAPITDSVLNFVLEMDEPNKSMEELDSFLDKEIEKLRKHSENNEVLPEIPVPQELLMVDENQIRDLLSKKIENPNPTDRDILLLETLSSHGNRFIENVRTDFEDPSVDRCPYCLRSISRAEKNELLDAISKAFSSVVDEHKSFLQAARLRPLNINLEPFAVLGPEAVQSVEKEMADWNILVSTTNALLDKKHEDAYTPITIETLGFEKGRESLLEQVEQLNQLRKAWNAETANRKSIISNLQKANKELAWHETRASIEAYKTQQEKEKGLTAAVDGKLKSINDFKKQMEDVKLRKQNATVALDAINRDLAFIFLDPNRLVLEGRNGEYKLLVNGRPVRPDSVSSGERNAIGLCYYFSLLASGTKSGEEFDNPLLLVIDDPISSFDYENEIAILSYCAEKVKGALKSNDASKVVIMTHNRQVMQHLSRLVRDFESAAGQKKTVQFLELSDNKLLEWKDKSLDYRSSINWLYNYAVAPSSGNRRYAGNIARKTIEAYSTFQHSMGFREVMQNETILTTVNPESARNYFRRMLTRIVLNWESHEEDIIKAEGDIAANPQYDDLAIDTAVRDVLCFIYKTDEKHLLAHIADSNAKKQLDAWCSKIEALC